MLVDQRMAREELSDDLDSEEVEEFDELRKVKRTSS